MPEGPPRTFIESFGDPEATLVRYERINHVAVITLDDPPVNGYTHRMMRALDDSILRARFDGQVQVIVLTGAGRMFCAGANIEMLEASDPIEKYNFCLHANETLLRLEKTPKLVIAALNGHCIGGGLEIALAADLRVSAPKGGKMGLPEVTLGVLPGTGGTQRLLRLIGKSRAIELMISGALISFEKGKELGLINAFIEGDDFMAGVLAYAENFTTPKRASMAVGYIKRAVQLGADLNLESGLAIEAELQARLFASADAREGMSAFLQKRTPEFEGK